MASGELQRYNDIKLICDKLEKAAIRRAKKGDRESAKVAGLNSLLSVDQMLYATAVAADATRKPNSLRQPPAEAQTGPGGQQRSLEGFSYFGYPEDQEVWSACLKGDPEVALYTPEVGFGFEFNPFQGLERDREQALRDLLGIEPGEDLAEEFENCFDCDLRVQFDFQLQPVNLLLELDNLLDEIKGTIDFWKNYADPISFLKNFCELWDMFGQLGLCIQDWITILLGLQALMAKYANASIQMTFDWTVLFGGLLKFIIDALAQLIEQIVQLLTAPIDCAIGFMTTLEQLWLELEDTLNTAVAFGDALSFDGFGQKDPETGELNLGPFGDYSGNGTKASIGWEEGSGGLTVNGREQGIIPRMGPESDPSETEPPRFDVDKGDWGDGIQNLRGDGKIEIPTGFEMRGKNGLEDAFDDPTFKFANPFQKIILSLQEVKRWITTLFANILFSLKSLNALVSGGIKVNLKNIGFLMLVIDIINLCKVILAMIKSGINPCEDDIEAIAEFIETYYNGSSTTIEGNVIGVTAPGGYENTVVVRKNPAACEDPTRRNKTDIS